jgi:hypothetical protein
MLMVTTHPTLNLVLYVFLASPIIIRVVVQYHVSLARFPGKREVPYQKADFAYVDVVVMLHLFLTEEQPYVTKAAKIDLWAFMHDMQA